MAIQLPDVKRIEPQDPASVGRLQDNVPDGRADLQQTGEALDNVAKQVIKFRNDQADQAADNIATEKTNQFETWHKMMLYGDPGDANHAATVGLINQQGDPTELYRAFREQANEKLKELSTSGDDTHWDDETQKLVNRRLGKKAEQLSNEGLTQYGNQQRVFEDANTAGAVKLAQDRLVSIDSAQIDPAHPETLDLIRASIADIKRPRIAQSIRNGGAKIDPNGDTPYVDPKTGEKTFVTFTSRSAEAKVQEDVSKAVFDASENLTKSAAPGSLEKAQLMKDTFSKYFTGEQSGKFDEGFRKAKVEQDANDIAAKTRGMTDANQINRTIEASGADEKTKDLALKISTDRGSRQEALVKQQQVMNANTLAKAAIDMKIADPTLTESDWKASDVYRHLADKTPIAALNAADKVFNPPKISDIAAITRTAAILRGDGAHGSDLGAYTQAELMTAASGLHDPQAFMKQVAKALSPNSAAQFHATSVAMQELQSQGLAAGRYKIEIQGQNSIAKDGKYAKILAQDQMELTPLIQKLAIGGVQSSDIKAAVHNFIISKQKNEPYVAPEKWHATGAAFGTPPAAPQQMSVDAVNGKAKRDYYNEFGKNPSPAQRDAYIKANPKRYGQ